MIPYSLLDLAPIVEGSTPRQALLNARSLAQVAEQEGYQRFWLAEHHNMTGIASAATAVAIGYVAEGTSTIRVGSGGIMLPNHAPLMVAEQFGTLASLYPGRIDLGLGRAPGTDSLTMQALRRYHDSVDQFPRDVQELQYYFRPAAADQAVRAIPGEGLRIPIWLLGSSLFSAQLAAAMGLPFAFAAHFAPDYLQQALDLYRNRFRPSEQLSAPWCIAAIPLYAADTDEEAQLLMSSVQQQFVALRRGTPGPLKPPLANLSQQYSSAELAAAAHALREAVVGGPERIREGIRAFAARTGVNEIMFSSHIYDHEKRLHCVRLAASACRSIRQPDDAARPIPD